MSAGVARLWAAPSGDFYDRAAGDGAVNVGLESIGQLFERNASIADRVQVLRLEVVANSCPDRASQTTRRIDGIDAQQANRSQNEWQDGGV